MKRMLQAYFQTEDDALQVKDELIKIKADKIEIGNRDGTGNGKGRIPLAAPLFAGNSTPGGTGVTGATGGTGGTATPLFAVGALDSDTDGKSNRDYPMVLSAEINEAHYAEAVASVKMNNGHIDA